MNRKDWQEYENYVVNSVGAPQEFETWLENRRYQDLKKTQDALREVFQELNAMPQAEFKALLEEHISNSYYSPAFLRET